MREYLKKKSAFFPYGLWKQRKISEPIYKSSTLSLFLLIVLVYRDPEDLKESLLMLCNNGHQLYRRQMLKMYRTRPTHLSPLTKWHVWWYSVNIVSVVVWSKLFIARRETCLQNLNFKIASFEDGRKKSSYVWKKNWICPSGDCVVQQSYFLVRQQHWVKQVHL